MRRSDDRKATQLISAKAFARRLGLAHGTIYKAIAAGRISAYDREGNLLVPGTRGAKFLKPAEAERQWRDGQAIRRRGETEPTSLLEARKRKLIAEARMQECRTAEREGRLIPREAAIAAARSTGLSIQRIIKSMTSWSEELYGAGQAGGLPALVGLLRAKSIELCNSLADLIEVEGEADLRAAEAEQADGH